jgi:hypothetical protein
VVAGIDVAGPGKDETVVTIRCGDTILEQGFWTDADPRGAGQVKGLTDERSLSQLSQISL